MLLGLRRRRRAVQPRPARRIRRAAPGAAGRAARFRADPARSPARRARPNATPQQQTLDALFGGPRAAQRGGEATRSAAPARRAAASAPAWAIPQTNTVAKGAVTRDILAAPQGDGREAQAVIGG